RFERIESLAYFMRGFFCQSICPHPYSALLDLFGCFRWLANFFVCSLSELVEYSSFYRFPTKILPKGVFSTRKLVEALTMIYNTAKF
ncbi:hypothetical protein AB4344_20975, partial [Vibrio breoganii]